MATAKRGKRKFAERQLRGVNTARRLARKTQNRAQAALTAVIAGGYRTDDLLDDVMEGASDVMDAFLGTGSPNWGLPVAAFRYALGTVFPAPPPPLPRRLVDLTETVTAGQIELGDLWGIADPGGGNPLVIRRVPFGGIYRLRLPDLPNGVIGPLTTDEVDEVVVEVQAIPAEIGLYRGALTLQNSPVILAEIVFVIT